MYLWLTLENCPFLLRLNREWFTLCRHLESVFLLNNQINLAWFNKNLVLLCCISCLMNKSVRSGKLVLWQSLPYSVFLPVYFWQDQPMSSLIPHPLQRRAKWPVQNGRYKAANQQALRTMVAVILQARTPLAVLLLVRRMLLRQQVAARVLLLPVRALETVHLAQIRQVRLQALTVVCWIS